MSILEQLNNRQREAASCTDSHVRIIAGAGSGKTRVVTVRIAYLIDECHVYPNRILAITFTNKAAREMKERVESMLGPLAASVRISTIHSFCVRLLREDIQEIGYPRSFTILDSEDQKSILKEIYKEKEIDTKSYAYGAVLAYISSCKTAFVDPQRALQLAQSESQRVKANVYASYEQRLRDMFALDFDDLLIKAHEILKGREDVREKWQRRFDYIHVDEFQDVDELQYDIVKLLCAPQTKLCVVGDPDQTIYTWRGANVKYLTEFDRAFPQVQTVMMMQNYRSTPEILAAANALIAKNHFRIEKTLVPMLPGGAPVLCHFAVSQTAEAEWIAEEMQKLCAAGVPYRDMTVLYRAHYVSRAVEEVLLAAKIPYTIYSGVQFFDRAEIKDALSYLRMIVYRDDLSFRRIANTPRRNLGKSRMARLEAYAAEKQCSLYTALCDNIDTPEFKTTKGRQFIALIESFSAGQAERPISEVLTELMERSGYETMLRTEGSQERLDNLAELKQSIYEYETTCGEESTLEAYLARVALMTNTDTAVRGDCVRLMTVHAAKGLEFPYVFLCGMNEGVFPSRKVRTLPGMEEERRLAFVALTRAERGLYLSEADGWNFDGSTRYPSRFLLDIGRDALTYTKEPREGLIRETERAVADSLARLSAEGQAAAFAVGLIPALLWNRHLRRRPMEYRITGRVD